MRQKVNPHGLRVGIVKDWDSKWFTEKLKEIEKVQPSRKRTVKKQKIKYKIQKIIIHTNSTPKSTTKRMWKPQKICA